MNYIHNNKNFKNVVISLLSLLVLLNIFNNNSIDIKVNNNKCMSYEQLKEVENDRVKELKIIEEPLIIEEVKNEKL